jgi:hypothetical protein
LKLARRTCVLALAAWLMPAAQAAEPQPPAKAAESATPAKTPPPKPADAAKAAPPMTEADEELLEFLGSVDAESEDEDWLDYLAQTDVAKVAKDKKK